MKEMIEMVHKQVPVVDSSSSKADELAALGKMASCAQPNSYLAGLFSPELVGWVEAQIRADMPANAWAQWQHDVKSAYDESARLRMDLAEAEADVKELDRLLQAEQKLVVDLKYLHGKEMGRKAQAYAALIDKRNRLGERVVDLAQRLTDWQNRAISSERQVMSLKAELYDLHREAGHFDLPEPVVEDDRDDCIPLGSRQDSVAVEEG